MSALSRLDPLAESKRLDIAADQAIAACDGDMRATIRALILANEYFQHRNRELASCLSVGFVRGQLRADNEFEDGLKSELDD